MRTSGRKVRCRSENFGLQDSTISGTVQSLNASEMKLKLSEWTARLSELAEPEEQSPTENVTQLLQMLNEQLARFEGNHKLLAALAGGALKKPHWAAVGLNFDFLA